MAYIDLKEENGYNMQTDKLRRQLGIDGKLPEHGLPATYVGDTRVLLWSKEQAHQENPKAVRPHRLMAECKYCKQWVPAGRLFQHVKVHPERYRFSRGIEHFKS